MKSGRRKHIFAGQVAAHLEDLVEGGNCIIYLPVSSHSLVFGKYILSIKLFFKHHSTNWWYKKLRPSQEPGAYDLRMNHFIQGVLENWWQMFIPSEEEYLKIPISVAKL